MGWRQAILLRLYPRRWRERYGGEFEALLEDRPPGVREVVDVARGALDAHLAPQLVAERGSESPVVLVAQGAGRSTAVASRFGAVGGLPAGDVSRRTFLRRMLGAGVGLLSLEFLGGTLAFLWPNLTEGLGAELRVGTLEQIRSAFPPFAQGWPFSSLAAQSFLVNVPAARELALGREASVPDPAADEILALWRTCPHLGCFVPDLCETRKRFECRCHGSTFNVLGEKLERGPAKRGMDRFAVRIDDQGVLIVDTRSVVRGPPEGRITFKDPHTADAGCA
jgi:nitrite reductase/ring-hydroxylating ferredoxin subunit